MGGDEWSTRPRSLAERVRQGRSIPTSVVSGRRPASPAPAISRIEAITWAATVVADPRAVFLDTETTGLGPDAEVVDVAVVDVLGRVLLDTLVRPHGHIPPDASRIHGIYDHHVAGAPSWGEVQPRLCEALAGRMVVVYNAPYDWGVVTGCDGRWRLASPAPGWTCAMRAYAAFRGEPGQRGGHRWHKLERAVIDCGGQIGGHRAHGDALACRWVVLSMAAEGADVPF